MDARIAVQPFRGYEAAATLKQRDADKGAGVSDAFRGYEAAATLKLG